MLTNFSSDARIAGRLEFDMTFLRTKKKVPLAEPRYGETKLAKPHYCVELEISAELNGMLLEYSARYPSGCGGKIMSRGQVCVSAAFAPGCA